MQKVIATLLFVVAMTAMWAAFKEGGTAFLLGALMVMAVYEIGYRATFGHWINWRAGPAHSRQRHRQDLE
jgi:hypothetical protein